MIVLKQPTRREMLAVSLVEVVDEISNEDELVWALAASGFRDTSRVAASDLAMMLDILATNRRYVAAMAGRFHRRLGQLIVALEAGVSTTPVQALDVDAMDQDELVDFCHCPKLSSLLSAYAAAAVLSTLGSCRASLMSYFPLGSCRAAKLSTGARSLETWGNVAPSLGKGRAYAANPLGSCRSIL